ncbi:MAG: C40 family peptidase [Bacteroidales bacterium]|nr:C40 family peptidase [Bacteroidales bacterium]
MKPTNISDILQVSLSGKKSLLPLIFLLMLSLPACRSQRETSRPTASPTADRAFYQEHSQKLGYQLNGTEDPILIREVSSWLGTPHRYAGNTRQGADCSGFVIEVFRAVYQTSLPRSSSDMASHTRNISKAQLREGDLVFFRTSGGRKVSHVGIYLSNNKFIHVSSTRGVMVSDLDEPYFVRTFAKAGRVR